MSRIRDNVPKIRRSKGPALRNKFLLGNILLNFTPYKNKLLILSLVVLEQKELLVNTVLGVLNTKIESMKRRAVPQVHIPFP